MANNQITLFDPDDNRSKKIKAHLAHDFDVWTYSSFISYLQNIDVKDDCFVFLIAEDLIKPKQIKAFVENYQKKFRKFPVLVYLSEAFNLEKKKSFEEYGFTGSLLYSAIEKGIAPTLLEKTVERFNTMPIDFANPSKKFNNLRDYSIPVGKRLFDIVFSGLALLFLLPFFAIIAILIKRDSRGPVFYISKRVGRGFEVFDFYKFRTMDPDADKKLKEMGHLNQYAAKEEDREVKVGEMCAECASEGVQCAFPLYTDSGVICEKLFHAKQADAGEKFNKFTNDPRVTKLGNFLRNTSIDELPQLFNVLKGDMSIVGNRPLPLYEAEKLTTNDISKRFMAPAGITGLWQVTKRGKGGDMSPEERMQLDNDYAERFNLWFDFQIILKTIPALFQKENV